MSTLLARRRATIIYMRSREVFVKLSWPIGRIRFETMGAPLLLRILPVASEDGDRERSAATQPKDKASCITHVAQQMTETNRAKTFTRILALRS